MDRHRLRQFTMTRNPNSGDLRLLVEGAVLFKSVLNRAFPNLYFSRTFEDRHGFFTWGTYIKRADAQLEHELTSFCQLLRDVWFLEDDLTESVALSLHTETSPAGANQKTEIGRLVYEAKPYNQTTHRGDKHKAKELAERMAKVVQQYPTYRQADLIVPLPGSNADKPYDLPSYLCGQLSTSLSIPQSSEAVVKIRESRPMKGISNLQDKIDNVEGAFQANQSIVLGKKILLVDDIYQTGFTINEVGRALMTAGAHYILGLVATKTMQDLTETE